MIGCIAVGITKWLLATGAIQPEDRELYEYAVHSFVFALIPIVFLLTLSWMSAQLVEGFLLLIPFMFIRKFSGGYHFKSPTVCLFASCLLYAFFLWIICALQQREQYVLCSLLTIISTLSLICFSPVDSEERTLDDQEKVFFKKAAIVFVMFFSVLYFGMAFVKLWNLAVPIGIGVFLSAFLQFLRVMSKRFLFWK